MYDNLGDMHMYQQTQMDETDLAKHNFRSEKEEQGRSIGDFIEDETNIY